MWVLRDNSRNLLQIVLFLSIGQSLQNLTEYLIQVFICTRSEPPHWHVYINYVQTSVKQHLSVVVESGYKNIITLYELLNSMTIQYAMLTSTCQITEKLPFEG